MGRQDDFLGFHNSNLFKASTKITVLIPICSPNFTFLVSSLVKGQLVKVKDQRSRIKGQGTKVKEQRSRTKGPRSKVKNYKTWLKLLMLSCLIQKKSRGSSLPSPSSRGRLVSVFGQEEGYTVKYGLSPRDFPYFTIFYRIS